MSGGRLDTALVTAHIYLWMRVLGARPPPWPVLGASGQWPGARSQWPVMPETVWGRLGSRDADVNVARVKALDEMESWYKVRLLFACVYAPHKHELSTQWNWRCRLQTEPHCFTNATLLHCYYIIILYTTSIQLKYKTNMCSYYWIPFWKHYKV